MRYLNLPYFAADDLRVGTRVLMRIDGNVSLDEPRPPRLVRTLPDMENVLAAGGRLILATHRGRPKGKEETLSTRLLVPQLEALLERPVVFLADLLPEKCEVIWRKAPEAVILLENVRFFEGEKKNTRAFAKQLAALADLYINNAFGVCHRAHASVKRITKYLPSYAGALLKNEILNLNKPFDKPFVFVLGGAKMETKVPLLKNLAPQADTVLLSSGFASFDRALHDLLPLTTLNVEPAALRSWKRLAKKFVGKFVLPVDLRLKIGEKIEVMKTMADKSKGVIIDIGPDTELKNAEILAGAKSILWNGPLGQTEDEDGKNGTMSLVHAMQENSEARVVIGGGDTADFLPEHEIESHMFVSTGGGATLAFLGGEAMPGLDALM